MGKKSGTAGQAVLPTKPDLAEDADDADPGKVSETKAEQVKTGSGKYGSEKAKPHKPATAKEEKKSWVEIELKDDKNNAIAGEKYEIELPDGSVAEGTLDEKGFARVEGFDKGSCKIKFPEMDEKGWKKA